MKIFQIALCASLLLVACNTGNHDVGEHSTDPNTETTPPANTPPAADHSTWEGFWADFQKAVAANDKEQVRALCHFNGALTEKDYDDSDIGYSLYFMEEMREVIAKTTADKVAPHEDGMVTDMEDPRSITYSETSDEDEDMGMALILYFAKTTAGKYRMVAWMAAG